MSQFTDFSPRRRPGGATKIGLVLLLLVVLVVDGTLGYLGVPQVGTPAIASQQEGFVSDSPPQLQAAEGFDVTPHPSERYVTVTGVETPPENGVPPGITLSRADAEQFAGKEVTVTATVRSSAVNGGEAVAIVYYTLGQGNSGWQPMPLTSDFTDVSFDYSVPSAANDSEEDYVGIWPAVGVSVDIKSVRVTLKNTD